MATAGLIAAMAFTVVAGHPLQAQEKSDQKSPLTIEGITIEPAAVSADTLCKLRVELKNSGTQTASQLDFKVSINGQQLAVYQNQLFMYPVGAGKGAEIKLYNFWTTETSRPRPADGKLKIEVALVAAQWMDIKDEEGVEVWQPLGAVEGLPVSRSVTLTLQP